MSKVTKKRAEEKVNRHQMILDDVFQDIHVSNRKVNTNVLNFLINHKKLLQDKVVKNLALKSHLRELKASKVKMEAFVKQEAREKLSKTIRRQQADEKLYHNVFESALQIQKDAIREERKVIQERNDWLRNRAESKQEEIEK